MMTKYKNNMMRYLVLAALFLLINSLTIHRTEFFTHTSSIENPEFILSLQYGSLDRFEAESANAQIFWNTQKIGTLTPEDQQVQTFSARVKVVQGKNKLTIKGTQQSTGIIIDNVKLIREGTTDNIIQNGDFEKKFPTGVKSVNTFPGWTGEPTRTNGKEQNKHWLSTLVALIGSDPKQTIVQNFNFDRQYRLLISRYFLSFKYAAQAGSSLNSALGKVRWNDQVFSVEPTDFAVHEFKQEVNLLKNTLNTLKFTGQGTPDGFGLTIDDVRLVALGGVINLVINGEFQMPHIKGQTQSLNILPGWQSANKEVTIGVGSFFSKNWDKKVGQVLTLDNNENLIIDQAFNFGADFSYIPKEKPYFVISFNYARPEGVAIEKSKGQLLLDGEVIAQFSPDNDIVNSFKEKVSLKPGNNEFTLRPQKGHTIVVSDFKIVREGQEQNIANNGNFSEPAYDGFIVGWSGPGQVLESQKANSHWKDAKVVLLSSEKHNSISQGVLLNKDFRIKTNKFILEFDFVTTANAELEGPLAEVSWNGKVFNIIAHNRKLNKFKIPIVASRGQNLLTFEGQGKNGEGVTIDNIKLIPYGSSSKLLSNGDFEDPQIKGGNFKQCYVIAEWDGHNLEVGLGEKYSESWPEANGQVLSLATPHKTVISKIVSLSQQLSIFDHEPLDFKFSFKYAAQEGKPLDKSGGEIFWNKVLIGDIVPTNYKINSYAISFKAKPGINQLFIKGAGGLEAYGLTLDQVQLHRQGSKDNLIENGLFELPPTPGWNSIVNHGPLLNHHWSKSHVARVDAVQNLTLSKTFQFDSHNIYKTNKFVLKFDYALHKDGKVGQSEGSCSWNNQNFKIKPTNNKVQKFEVIVFASNGENKLSFEGEGITIDDVRLVPWGSSLSVLLNGGFEDPQFSTTSFEGLPSGWNGESIQFSKGYHASTQWPYFSNQVLTLTKRNSPISQIVVLSKDKRVIHSEFPAHELELDFAAVDDLELEQSKGEVYWNNRLVSTLVPTQQGVKKLIIKLDVVPGTNTLTFKGLESGILISNIDFVRYTLTENIIQNGQFKQNVVRNKIPSWQGSAQIFDSNDYGDNSEAWKGAKVAFLKNGDSISQSFNFDGNLRLVTNKFALNFQYTVRQGVKFQTAKARVIWNDQIFNLAPTEYDLHQFSEMVQARKGNNFIIFESNGVKRHLGTFAEGFTLDNVWIRSYGSGKNLLINGGFEQPKIEGFDYGMFTSVVPGWTTKDIYLGVGYYFSKNWADTQIIELDGNHENAKIMQGIKMGKNWEIIQ